MEGRDEPVTNERSETRSPGLWRRIRSWPWRVILPWFLFTLAAAAALVFALAWLSGVNENDRIEDVERATQRFVTALTNFSADTIEADVQEIRSFAVGNFEQEVDTFFGPDAIDAITQAEATSEGEIQAIFVQDIDEDAASVFVVVSETVTNSLLEEPQTDVLRLEVGLVRTEGDWKVDRVDVFQAPGSAGVPGLP